VCKRTISELTEGVLYRSSDPDMIRGEYFSVNRTVKVVSILQTIMSDCSDHPLPVSHLARIITALGMQPGGAFADYKLEFVYVTDWQYAKLHGVTLKHTFPSGSSKTFGRLQWAAQIARRKAHDKQKNKTTGKQLATLATEMPPADVDWVAERLQTWVVRASVFQNPHFRKTKLPTGMTERSITEVCKRYGLSFRANSTVGAKEKR
jgi:hypothetical protein